METETSAPEKTASQEFGLLRDLFLENTAYLDSTAIRSIFLIKKFLVIKCNFPAATIL